MSLDTNGDGLLRVTNGTMNPLHSPTFIRVTHDHEGEVSRVFVAHAAQDGTGTILRLPRARNNVTLHIERLIVAGT